MTRLLLVLFFLLVLIRPGLAQKTYTLEDCYLQALDNNIAVQWAQQNNLSYSLYQEKHRLGQVSSVELFTARDILNASSSKYIQANLELFFRHQLLLLLKAY